jgi:RNA polymerase sigma factor (sigma-70 family)
MALGALAGIVPRLRHALHATTSDADLLDRFVSERDAAAFEALVRRHGPMVFAVCRRILRHAQDAEDAFQATFLILVYKAASVSPRSKLAGWLHGVAQKTALKARQRATRRTEVESQAPARGADAPPNSACDEAELLLDQELAGLPDRYRLPIIMCDLEGRLRSEVASALSCSEGTLSSRLTRGRRMLADRLKRRGVHLSVGALVVILTERTAALAEPVIASLSPAALTAVSPSVAQLATGVMKSMFLKKLQAVAMGVTFAVAATFALTGIGVEPTHAAAPVPATPAAPAVDEKALNEALADVDANLLLNRKVLRDMKCDIDQLDRIMDKVEAGQATSQQKMNEAFMQLKQNAGNPGNPQAFQQAIKDAQETGEKELRKAVNEVVTTILTPAQKKRLREIDLQSRGYEAFLTPSVAKSLQLTEKQKEQMAENAKQVDEGIQQGFQKPIAANGVVTTFDFNQNFKDNRDEGTKRALAILTDEQKTGWKKMTGDPIAYQINRPWAGGRSTVGGFGFGGGMQIAPGGGLPARVLPLPAAPAVPVKPPIQVKPEPAPNK